MKKIFSFILIGSGGFLVLASGLLGLGFGRIVITNVIIKASLEAVIELVALVIISVLGFVIGFYLMRTGKVLK